MMFVLIPAFIVFTFVVAIVYSSNVNEFQSVFMNENFESSISFHSPNNPNQFGLSGCGDDGPCSNFSSFEDSEDAPDPLAAYLDVFGEITSAFISSYATEFDKIKDVAGVGGNWQNIGITTPTEDGLVNFQGISYIESGRIRNVYQSTTDINTLYVLTAGGGLWKTTNLFDPSGFPTWIPLGDNLLSTCGGSFALGRSSDTIYLGLGDPLRYFSTRTVAGCIGGMMYISHDGGATWGSPIYFSANINGVDYTATIILEVQVDRTKSPDSVLVSTEIGIFQSVDGGASFSHVYPTQSSASLILAFQTRTFSLVQSLAHTSAGWIGVDYMPSVRQLIMSVNGGQNWSIPVGSNWASVTGSDNGVALGRTTFSVATPGESVVYALVGIVVPSATIPDTSQSIRAMDQLDVFKSVDGGLTWKGLSCNASHAPINPIPNVQTNLNVMGAQAFYDQLLLVDWTDPTRDTVYVGGQLSSVKTTDGGKTWTVLSTWYQGYSSAVPYVHADFHTSTIVKTPNNATAVLFGTDGGLFISPDGGKSWFHQLNKGLSASLINFISSSPVPSLSGIVAVGLQDEGTKLRAGTTSLWNTVFGGDGDGCAFNQVPTQFPGLNLLVASVYFNKFLCMNATRFGTVTALYNNYCNTGINLSESLMFFSNVVPPIAGSDPTGFVYYTYTYQSVYRSTVAPIIVLQWKSIATNGVTPGLSKKLFRSTYHGVGVGTPDQIAVCKQDTVALTINGGLSWFEPNITETFPSWNYTTSPLWVTLEGDVLLFLSSESVASTVATPGVPPPPRVIYTTDFGLTWSSISEGLPNVPVSKLASFGGKVYAASWLGVYVNDLTLAPWRKLGAVDLPTAQINDLYISSNILYAGSYGRGAWQFDTSTIPNFESSTPSTKPTSKLPSLAPVPGSISNSSTTLSGGAIAGIVIGSVVFGLILAGLLMFFAFKGKSASGTAAAAAPVTAPAPAVNPEAGLNSTFSIGEAAP